jgi:hypothetical protein
MVFETLASMAPTTVGQDFHPGSKFNIQKNAPRPKPEHLEEARTQDPDESQAAPDHD